MHPRIGNHVNVLCSFFVQATKCASVLEGAPRWYKPSTTNLEKTGQKKEKSNKQNDFATTMMADCLVF
jgi:hypothetical protein